MTILENRIRGNVDLPGERQSHRDDVNHGWSQKDKSKGVEGGAGWVGALEDEDFTQLNDSEVRATRLPCNVVSSE